jgi:hypothetical protein
LRGSFEDKRLMNPLAEMSQTSTKASINSSTWPPSSNQIPLPKTLGYTHQYLNRLSHSQY